MAKAGRGREFATNPDSIWTVQQARWLLNSGYQEGEIVENPAINSPAGKPGGINSLSIHCGSVRYTFDISEVTVGTDMYSSYLDRCTPYSSYLTVEATEAVWLKELPCSRNSNPNSGDVVPYALPAGTRFTVTKLYQNPEGDGNYWYKAQVASGEHAGKEGYIYCMRSGTAILAQLWSLCRHPCARVIASRGGV